MKEFSKRRNIREARRIGFDFHPAAAG